MSPDMGESVVDAALDLSVEEDLAPPPILEEPRAQVFLNDPITNEGQLSEVVLEKSTSERGLLTSEAVQVFNCLNEEGGLTGEIQMGFTIEVSLCKEEQTVTPDADGHYLSIAPPEDYTDPNDSFAEVMMYYYVNEIADYYLEKHEY
jgi:hypothetical protein